ncbi:MAG: hypothetical protein ACLGP3_12010 [Acidobacteriota bacterium]
MAGSVQLPATNVSDRAGGHAQEHRQPLLSLVEQLMTMDQDQGVHFARGNLPGSNGSFPKSSGSAKDSVVVAGKLFRGVLLCWPELSSEFHNDLRACESLVTYLQLNVICAQKGQYVCQTSTWCCNILGKVLSAGNYARLGKCWKQHSLGFSSSSNSFYVAFDCERLILSALLAARVEKHDRSPSCKRTPSGS